MSSKNRFHFVNADSIEQTELMLKALGFKQTPDRSVDNRPAKDKLIFDMLHKRYWKLDFKCFENNALHIRERYNEELTEYKDERK